jgi:ABC-type amino acid transport substrate-binding protein
MKSWAGITVVVAVVLGLAILVPAASAQTMPNSLVLGVDPHFRPMSFASPDGKIIGFDIELAEELGKRLGAKIRIDDMAFDGIIPALQGKRIDLTDMVITPQRQTVVDYTRPFLTQTIRAVVKADNKVDPTPATLASLRVGVMANTSAATALGQVPGVKPTFYNTVVDEYNDLVLGRLDVVVVESVNGGYTVATQYKDRLRMTETVVIPQARLNALAMRKGEPERLAWVDAAIAVLLKDGSLARLHDKWFGNTSAMPRP